MEIPDEMIETLVPAVREQLEAPDTAYVKACLERLTGREKLEEQEALELMAQALAMDVDAVILESHRNWVDNSPIKSFQLSAKYLAQKF